MKVLQIINSLGTGGAEKLLLDTIPLYREAGVEMDIVLFWNNNHQFTATLKALQCCNVFILNESNSINDIYKLGNIFKLRRILKNYDLAHVHLFPTQYYAVFANLLNGNSCKLVFTEHNTSNRRIQKKYLKPIEWFIYLQYSKIVCISPEIEDILKKHIQINSNKFIIIENGVDINAIEKAVAIKPNLIHSSLNDDDILIVQVSAFRKQKDQPTLIRAFKRLKNQQIKLLFIGDGEEKENCIKLVADLDIEDKVLFLGQRMDVATILKSSYLIVLSTFYEGLSLSSIEGLASGKPFLASDVPGLRNVVNGAGILFECANDKDLADKIEMLLLNKDYYNKVSLSGQNRAKKYNILTMVQKHINLYSEFNGK